MIRRTSASVLALALLAVLAAPTLAASPSPTAEMTAGAPSAGGWKPFDADTGPLTAADLYGSSASKVNGFGDAYRRVWSRTDQVLIDRVERFTSVFWAAFRFGESSGLAARSASHATYKKIPSFSPQAYETTDLADAEGFLSDGIVFTKGDYLAVVEVAAKVSAPRDVLIDQASRQLALIPMPTAEYTQLGLGIVLGGAGLLVVLVALIVGLILLIRRRRPAIAGGPAFASMPYQPAAGVQLSPDGQHWWDGRAWQDTAQSVPPGSPRSPDGSQWWDGARWRPAPPA